MNHSNGHVLLAAAILAADRLPQVPFESSQEHDEHVSRVVCWAVAVADHLASEVETLRGSEG
jgi:hypothetical protein